MEHSQSCLYSQIINEYRYIMNNTLCAEFIVCVGIQISVCSALLDIITLYLRLFSIKLFTFCHLSVNKCSILFKSYPVKCSKMDFQVNGSVVRLFMHRKMTDDSSVCLCRFSGIQNLTTETIVSPSIFIAICLLFLICFR